MQQEKDSNIKINKQVDLDFTGKDLTSWGGISSMMAKYLDKLKFSGWVEENIPIEDTGNNSCGKYSKLMSLFLTVLTGGEKFSHISNWMRRFNGVATKYLNNYLSWRHKLKGRINSPESFDWL